MERPIWIEDEPFIQQLLARLVENVETGKIPRVPLRATGWSQPLFDHRDNEGARLFSRIEWLTEEPQDILRVEYPARSSEQDVPYEGAWVYLKLEKARMVRSWLGRKQINEERMALADAVFAVADKFADRGKALVRSNLEVPGKSPQDIVDAFVRVRDVLRNVYTVRELSATCFWGDSKFLDSRMELLQQLYPDCLRYLRERPLFLQVRLPAEIDGILIIENQDTFMRACLGQLPEAENLAVVFGSGFKATSSAIRQRDKLRFFYSGIADANAVVQFEACWFNEIESLPFHFFGDLDWSGMGILLALRQQFPALTAWIPGYERLRKAVEKGRGHLPSQARKGQQLFIPATGCPYADKMLLPTLTRYAQFADQESQFDGD